MPSDVYAQKFPETILPFVKLKKVFSMITIDKDHKQNIVAIKGDRGAIGLTKDEYKAFFLALSAITSQSPSGLQNGCPITKCYRGLA